jgi:hypothetical protein
LPYGNDIEGTVGVPVVPEGTVNLIAVRVSAVAGVKV